jgi:hypothetical protein
MGVVVVEEYAGDDHAAYLRAGLDWQGAVIVRCQRHVVDQAFAAMLRLEVLFSTVHLQPLPALRPSSAFCIAGRSRDLGSWVAEHLGGPRYKDVSKIGEHYLQRSKCLAVKHLTEVDTPQDPSPVIVALFFARHLPVPLAKPKNHLM